MRRSPRTGLLAALPAVSAPLPTGSSATPTAEISASATSERAPAPPRRSGQPPMIRPSEPSSRAADDLTSPCRDSVPCAHPRCSSSVVTTRRCSTSTARPPPGCPANTASTSFPGQRTCSRSQAPSRPPPGSPATGSSTTWRPRAAPPGEARMEVADVGDEPASAEDELPDAAFDRELAQRLEEELAEDEEPLEDDIEEQVVAENEPVPIVNGEGTEGSGVFRVARGTDRAERRERERRWARRGRIRVPVVLPRQTPHPTRRPRSVALCRLRSNMKKRNPKKVTQATDAGPSPSVSDRPLKRGRRLSRGRVGRPGAQRRHLRLLRVPESATGRALLR